MEPDSISLVQKAPKLTTLTKSTIDNHARSVQGSANEKKITKYPHSLRNIIKLLQLSVLN